MITKTFGEKTYLCIPMNAESHNCINKFNRKRFGDFSDFHYCNAKKNKEKTRKSHCKPKLCFIFISFVLFLKTRKKTITQNIQKAEKR